MNLDREPSDKEIHAYLEFLKKKLLVVSARQPINLTRSWARTFLAGPGVYAVFEMQRLIYVGETGSLQGRMLDLLDSRHHTLRRSLGHDRFSQEPGYCKATTKKRFPPAIEAKINQLLKDQMHVAALSVKLGRKELEESIVDTFKPL